MGELNFANILFRSQGNSGEACRIPLLVNLPWSSSGERLNFFDGEVVITVAGTVYEVSGIYGMTALPRDIPAKPPRRQLTKSGKS